MYFHIFSISEHYLIFNFIFSGIADYKDGTSTRKWQNHASLAAASVMKTIICAMDSPDNV